MNLPPIRADEPLPPWRLAQIVNGSPVRENERTAFLLALQEYLHDAVLPFLTKDTRRTEDRRAVVRERRKTHARHE
jgi:hypothetical protein